MVNQNNFGARTPPSAILLVRMGASALLVVLFLLLAACGGRTKTARVVADGLHNPLGLAQLPDGGLLIAEMGTGMDDDSAGVTLLREGQIGRFVSHIPSTRDSGDLAGAPLIALSPDAQTLYLGHFNANQLWTLPATTAQQLPDDPLTTADFEAVLFPQVVDYLVNPFDLAFDENGKLYVTDASANGIATESAENKTQFLHQFNRLPHPTNSAQTIDAVPTGIVHDGNEFLVTLTGGCPFPEGGGQVIAIGEIWRPRTIVSGLNMPIDVGVADDGALWVLEFATFRRGGNCFAGGDYIADSGRLSRVAADGTLQPAIVGLNTPGAFLFGADDTIYVSEVFLGRVLALQLSADASQWPLDVAKLQADNQTLTLQPFPIATLTP